MPVKFYTVNEWKRDVGTNPNTLGFRCPKCQEVQPHPYQCIKCGCLAGENPDICVVWIKKDPTHIWMCPAFEHVSGIDTITKPKGFRGAEDGRKQSRKRN